jgi:DNA-binding CsgD family transcriptional regulator
MQLHGRSEESVRIERMLAEARSGQSAALVILGEPGIGKTALLSYARERARGFRILQAVGVPAEEAVSYAGVDQVLAPVRGVFDELPPPQAAALRAALDLAPSARLDRDAVLRATHTVLTTLAGEGPVLCTVDDAHWIDRGSIAALSFAARRLGAEGIVVLFARRDGAADDLLAGLPTLGLGGLDVDAAKALLEERWPGLVAPEVLARLVEATGGNPLALLEARTVLTEEQLAGRVPLEYPLPVGEPLGRAFADRAEALSEDARTALVTAAAADTQTLRALTEDGAVPGVTAAALEECESAELVTIRRGLVSFRHPLARSALYKAATPAAQRDAHVRLAQAATGERRAVHLAAAASGPDEDTARELEDAGERALRRSGYGTAAVWFEQAADLTPAPDARARRLALAAEAACIAGRPERARALAKSGEELTDDPRLLADLRYVSGVLEAAERPVEGAAALIAAAEAVAQSDSVRASRLLTAAAAVPGVEGRVASTERAVELASDEQGNAIRARLVLASALAGEGRVEEAGLLLADAETLLESDPGVGAQPEILLLLLEATAAAGREPGAVRACAEAAVTAARELEARWFLPRSLLGRARASLAGGLWSEAKEDALEARRLAGDLHQLDPQAGACALLGALEARRGRAAECLAFLGEMIEATDAAETRALRSAILGLLEVGAGRIPEAIEELERTQALSSNGRGGLVTTAVDLVDAYRRAGRTEDAQRVAEQYAARSTSQADSLASACVAWCQALVASDRAYARAFQDALSALTDPNTYPFERARIELNYGERLRRSGARSEAREHLRNAHGIFELLGSTPWIDRARVELQATGETARRRDASTLDELTPQELQVLRAIVAGATYKEAAQKLVLSPKTIEFHLGKIYRKLGVRSRRELLAALERLRAEGVDVPTG